MITPFLLCLHWQDWGVDDDLKYVMRALKHGSCPNLKILNMQYVYNLCEDAARELANALGQGKCAMLEKLALGREQPLELHGGDFEHDAILIPLFGALKTGMIIREA